MTRSPSDLGTIPVGTPTPESSGTNCSADCASNNPDFGLGSGESAALVEIREKSKFLRSASTPYDHRRSEDFWANGAFHVYLTKVRLTWNPPKCSRPAPARLAKAFRALECAGFRSQGLGIEAQRVCVLALRIDRDRLS